MNKALFTATVVVLCYCYVDSADEDPLIVTPLLEAGKFKEAQQLSLITPDIGAVRSYTGFFTVNKECGNNLFFWFILARENWETAPVLLWLNGGPGATSMLGLLTEIGPFSFDVKKGLVDNKYHWTKKYNVIFLDQPAGSGYSFTKNNCYATTLTTVAKEAYEALTQFFKLFPNLQKNRFFLTGQSYAGHYIPAIAVEIDKNNENASTKINLIGLFIGNPWIDLRCHHYGEYLYQLGVVDENGRDSYENKLQNATKYINKNDPANAKSAFETTFDDLVATGLPSIYNVLYDKPDDVTYQIFVRNYHTRKRIHVGATTFNAQSDVVYDKLVLDTYIPNNHQYEYLLSTNKYIVGLYSGQLDIICLYTSLTCALRQLRWPGAGDYLAANRTQWYVGLRLAGWYKTAGNLFEVVFRNSGHPVPTDQPAAALEFITAAIADSPGSKLLNKLKTEPTD